MEFWEKCGPGGEKTGVVKKPGQHGRSKKVSTIGKGRRRAKKRITARPASGNGGREGAKITAAKNNRDNMPEDYIKQLEPLVGREFGPDVYFIEKGMVERFMEATGDDDQRWKEETPPTFPIVLVPKQLLHELYNAPIPLPRFLNGGNEYTYSRPIRAGDTISVYAKLRGVEEKYGKSGRVIVMRTEQEYINQRGETAVKGKHTYLRF